MILSSLTLCWPWDVIVKSKFATSAIVLDFSITTLIAFFCSVNVVSKDSIFLSAGLLNNDFPFSKISSVNTISNPSLKLFTFFAFKLSSENLIGYASCTSSSIITEGSCGPFVTLERVDVIISNNASNSSSVISLLGFLESIPDNLIISSTYFFGKPNPLPIVFPIPLEENNSLNDSFVKFKISSPSSGGGI